MLRCLVCGLETEQTGGTVCWDCGIGKLIPVEAEEGQPETSDVDFDPYENDDAFDDGDEQTKDILRENRTITAAMVEGVTQFPKRTSGEDPKAFRASQVVKRPGSVHLREALSRTTALNRFPWGGKLYPQLNRGNSRNWSHRRNKRRGHASRPREFVSAGEKKVLEAAVATQLILVEKIKKFCEAYDKDGSH